jgi:membrane fusion protein (multidrug efflux system)
MTDDAQIAPEEAPKSPSRGRRFRRILIVVVPLVLALLLVWFVHYEVRGKYIQSTNDAYLRADSVTVSPKISGYVDQVFVADNQDVKAGQPLVRIDPRDYRAQAAQYQAQIDVAAANSENVRATIGEQQAAIAQARAELAVARSDARFAADEVLRYTPLAASGAETREKLTDLRKQASQAASRVVAQQAALTSAERRIGSLEAQVRQAKAQGESAQAQLAAANVNLGSTIVRASVDGRVGDKSVRVGQFVQSGTRMMSVVPLGAIYVAANFKETQIGLMRVGQPVTIRVDALPGVNLRGRIESLSPGTGAEFSLLPPQNATGNFTKIVQRVPVRIAIDAGPEARAVLVPGLSATVKADTISAKGAERRIQDQQKWRDQAGK